jgi:hypothetical protein
VLDYARHFAEFPGQAIRVANLPEMAIQNVIILVGDVGTSIGILPQIDLGA